MWKEIAKKDLENSWIRKYDIFAINVIVKRSYFLLYLWSFN